MILVARRADQLEKVAEAAAAAHKAAGVQEGGKFVTVQLDVTDRTQVAALWSKVPQEFRNVDILGALLFSSFCAHVSTLNLTPPPSPPITPVYDVAAVNNAGGAHGTDRVGDIQEEDIDTMFATNVLGLISLTQLVMKGRSVRLPSPYPHRTKLLSSIHHERLQGPQCRSRHQPRVDRGKGIVRGW